jgi:hypothetical protein
MIPQVEAGAVPVVPAPDRRKRDNEEWRIQSDFFRWWREAAPGLRIWPGCLWHVPNGSMLGDSKKSRVIRSRMLTLAGMWNGVVDTFLMHPVPRPTGLSYWHGCFIEFKKPGVRNHKDGGLSPEQVEFINHALAHDYQCRVAYSWEEGRDAVLGYLGEPAGRAARPNIGNEPRR